MWIIPKTHQLYSRFAADMVASKEDLNLPGLNIESSLMWRSKPSQLKTWCQRWKRVSWLPHLYTRILKPCQRKSLETELTSCWGATRVSLFRKPGNVPEGRTPDTSGRSSGITSEQLDLFDVSLKMSKDTSALDSERSLEIWKNSVTKARGAYLARKRSMHLIRENGFLSWPTPTSTERSGINPKTGTGGGLSKAAKSWPTPKVVDTEGGIAKNVELKDGSFSRVNADGVRFGVKLKDAVDQQKQWPTVRVSSANGSSEKEIAEGNPKYRLETTVDIIERENWATPNTMDHLPQRSEEALIKQATTSRKGRKRPANLREQVDPEAVEIYEKQNLYPTPSARDHKGGSGTIVEKDGKFYRVSNTTSTKFGARLDAVVDVLEKKKYPTPTTDATDEIDFNHYRFSDKQKRQIQAGRNLAIHRCKS